MSATIISDPMVVSAPETQAAAAAAAATATQLIAQIEVESVKCDCCGLIEECTPGIHRKEAIKYEIVRTERLISTEEAMTKHMNFCKKFVSSGPPPDPTIHLIAAMRQILRRSLDSPRGLRSTPSSPNKTNGAIRAAALARSESCFPTLSG
ncbi:hypothetical protein OIU74_015084 [Salix koriyanagi]|uniref:Uncharacterized protein n=1 Tax=Salix koriyanagi TaxID=2511006 RepID=A0A9Q0PXC2_9ROSI|nr:hypothetical protein OIU74_015084 [Salix koriyanagi]